MKAYNVEIESNFQRQFRSPPITDWKAGQWWTTCVVLAENSETAKQAVHDHANKLWEAEGWENELQTVAYRNVSNSITHIEEITEQLPVIINWK